MVVHYLRVCMPGGWAIKTALHVTVLINYIFNSTKMFICLQFCVSNVDNGDNGSLPSTKCTAFEKMP